MTDRPDMPARRDPPPGPGGAGTDDAYAAELDRAIEASAQAERPAEAPQPEESLQLPLEEPGEAPTPEGEAGKERNRNLSPIVDAIEDEGPPRPTAPRRPRATTPTPPPALEPVAPPAPVPPAPATPAMGLYVALGLAAVALLVAVAVGFTGASLERRVALLENQAPPTEDPRIATLQAEVQRLRGDLTALRLRPAEPPPAADSGALDTLRDRLAAQEEALNRLAIQVQPSAPPAKPVKPADSPGKPPVAATPAPAATTAAPAAPQAPATEHGWSVNLITLASPAAADRLLAKYQKLGVSGERLKVTVKDKTLYRLRVPGFATIGDAKAYAEEAKTKLNLKDIWITRE